ncbi:MAG: M56 family metallopeptidase [Propionibacteriaceae bacterium]
MINVWTTGAVLVALALVLVGPGPWWVGRWAFLRRVPRAAVLLWQAGTIAALVSVIGGGTVLVLALLDPDQPHPIWQVALVLVAAFTAVVVVRLSWSLATVIRETGRRRARHRAAVDLLGQIDPDSPHPGLRILSQTEPMAYCLPSARESRVVVTRGTLEQLGEAEVDAVLAHERAHLRARHDVVLDTFTALHRAFPVAVRSEKPLQQSKLLVEMLADDAARRTTGPIPLARALVVMAGWESPSMGLAAAGTGVLERVRRLGEVDPPRWWSGAVYVLAAGLVLAPVAILLLPLAG